MQDETRRRFLAGAGATLLLACTHAEQTPAKTEYDVSPAEDLMREHGALNRILLVYDECLRRLDDQKDVPSDAIATSADIVRRFIESYHEKLEEEHVFPRLEKANRLGELVATLRAQHARGRELTAAILASARDAAKRDELARAMRAFVRMYRPHEAREDTVLFPAFNAIVSPRELDELGDRFEDKEHELFGKAGFEGVVEQIAAVERTLGLYDLSQFTPAG